MNRAFLIALVPPALVALAYFALAAGFGVHLELARVIGAAVGAVAAVFLVQYYTRRKTRPTRK